MDNRLWGALIVVVIIVLILIGMRTSWLRRKRRQDGLAVDLAVPADAGALVAVATGLYLATTPADNRLDRVAVAGLGFRARLQAQVTTEGVVLPIPGSKDVFIAASAISSVGTAAWTIDRGIEPGGLTVISWTLGEAEVESYFRFDEPAPFVAAVESIITTTAGSSIK